MARQAASDCNVVYQPFILGEVNTSANKKIATFKINSSTYRQSITIAE